MKKVYNIELTLVDKNGNTYEKLGDKEILINKLIDKYGD